MTESLLEIELYPQIFKIVLKKAGVSINKKPNFISISKKKQIQNVIDIFKDKLDSDNFHLFLIDGDVKELLSQD